MKIGGEYLNHLRFADDILICANTPHELQQMLQELTDERENQDLKMNKSKTKVVMENGTPFCFICQQHLDREHWKPHLPGTEIQHQKQKPRQRRITVGWTAFAKHCDIFKGNIGTCLKRHVYNSCVLPTMTYSAETWAHTTQAKNMLTAAQTKMEINMLNVTCLERKTNIWGNRKDNGHRRD